MAYTRSFMHLAHEARGYEFKGRPPTGRCILESRIHFGKLSILVQDLKPEVKYVIYLVFEKQNFEGGTGYVGLAVGAINVGINGKGEFRRDLPKEDLQNCILSDVVAVVILDDDAASITSPLCGYKSDEVQWRHGFRILNADDANGQAAKVKEPVILPEAILPDAGVYATPESVLPDVAVDATPESVLPDVGVYATPESVLPDVAVDATPEDTLPNIAIDAATGDALPDVGVEATPDAVLPDVDVDATPEATLPDVAINKTNAPALESQYGDITPHSFQLEEFVPPRASRPVGAKNPPPKVCPPLATLPQVD